MIREWNEVSPRTELEPAMNSRLAWCWLPDEKFMTYMRADLNSFKNPRDVTIPEIKGNSNHINVSGVSYRIAFSSRHWVIDWKTDLGN
jgi:hypothetical protein